MPIKPSKSFLSALIHLLPFLYLVFVSWLAGAPLTVQRVGGLLIFGILVLVGGVFCWRFRWGAGIVVGITILCGGVYGLLQSTWAAWGFVVGWMVMLLKIGDNKGSSAGDILVTGFLAFAAGFVPVAVGQFEERFSEEEFFAGLEVIALAVFWLLAWWVIRRVSGASHERADSPPAWRRLIPSIGVLAVCLGLGAWTVRAYQHSFFTDDVPLYAGISAENPFICGKVPVSPQLYLGEEIFSRYLALMEVNPEKRTPELGMLALGMVDQIWAEQFRGALLDEAARGVFTGPANSVKSVQLDAAMRVYYYVKVREAFPGLFGPEDEQLLQAWFAAINRRALTVEWVDWMYALAFSKLPEGLYENQENGAGLMAMLAWAELGDLLLREDNATYLEAYPRGWLPRFRNTDDAYIYQAIWMVNAYFQELQSGQFSEEKRQQAFEWLLLQSLPDAGPLTYNHPLELNPAGAAYLGAMLTNDLRLLWIAGRGVETQQALGGVFYAFPGVDEPLALTGHAPDHGSCLLYGDSGLPNQFGPLAPDKIVFRDGWERDSTYLLLNLRFTGWHRYKGTNTIAVMYRGEPLVTDALTGEPVWWLPFGRSHFRDKRIPRENLNGFVVRRSGMSAMLYGLTGVGGPWAQDPPYYAVVNRFEIGEGVDVSMTTMEGWRGWTQTREIHFVHDGPVVVFDRAHGPAGFPAGVVWHIFGKETEEPTRFSLGEDGAGELVLIPMGDGKISTSIDGDPRLDGRLRILFEGEEDGVLELISVFLPLEWSGAEVVVEEEGVVIRLEEKEMRMTPSNP